MSSKKLTPNQKGFKKAVNKLNANLDELRADFNIDVNVDIHKPMRVTGKAIEEVEALANDVNDVTKALKKSKSADKLTSKEQSKVVGDYLAGGRTQKPSSTDSKKGLTYRDIKRLNKLAKREENLAKAREAKARYAEIKNVTTAVPDQAEVYYDNFVSMYEQDYADPRLRGTPHFLSTFKALAIGGGKKAMGEALIEAERAGIVAGFEERYDSGRAEVYVGRVIGFLDTSQVGEKMAEVKKEAIVDEAYSNEEFDITSIPGYEDFEIVDNENNPFD